MLVAYSHEVNPDIIDPFRTTQEGYRALATGEIALLGYEDYPEPLATVQTIAELLLKKPSTAIMHFEDPAHDEDADSAMMGVNYHGGHSEGWHKIILQDPSDPDAGQWMLWTPPGAHNRTFYRRASSLDGQPFEFERTPTNPEKISDYYLHTGPSDEAITSFKELGFNFIDTVLSLDSAEYARLSDLSRAARGIWAP